MNILVVDDSPELRRFWEMASKDITTVDSGEKALEVYSSKKFDYVITDLNLSEYGPGKIDGFDVIKGIREKNPECKLALCTGTINSRVVKECQNLEVLLISKPSAVEKILKQIS